MKNKNLIFILTALEAIEKIQIYSDKFRNAEEFYHSDDQLQFNAVLKLLAVIGEESNRIDSKLLNSFESINWRAIKDLRNRLVHDYRGVDADIVYSIIEEDLHKLKFAFAEMFQMIKNEFRNEDLIEILNFKHYRHLSYLLE